jgi:hypothetical protein
VYAFVLGFERETVPAGGTGPRPTGPLKFARLRRFLRRHGIAPAWLVFFGALLTATFYGVHQLALFLLPGILLYLAGMAAVTGFTRRGLPRWLNKYSITAVGGAALALLLYAALPGLRDMTRYFLSYTPPWASGGSSAQSRAALFDFLMSEQRFPLAALFFIGTLMTASRKSRMGWLVWSLFVAVLAMLTLVFSHRVPTYLFFVYPFFLMIAAFGFVRLVEGESDRIRGDGRPFRRRAAGLFVLAALSVFILSPWIG